MSVDFLKVLNAKGPLPLELEAHLASIIQHKSLRKKEYILRPGQQNDIMIFIQRGLIRAFYKKGKKEINKWFKAEGSFIVSIPSFYPQLPSREYLQAIEPTEILYIKRQELFNIYEIFPAFTLTALLLTIDVLIEWDQRLEILNDTAEEKYKWLIANKGDLLQRRIPMKYLASFLGIVPTTLSRLQKEHLKHLSKFR